MKLSSKARYGLKAMCVLAHSTKNSVYPLATIASATGVSDSYLEQILIILRRKGLVSAVRGASGGYYISDNPDSISVGMIIRALEDNLEIVDCLDGKCVSKTSCPTFEVWQKLHTAINGALDEISLASLVK